MFVITYPLISTSLMGSVNVDHDEFIEHAQENNLEKVPLIELFLNVRFVFGIISQMNLMMTM